MGYPVEWDTYIPSDGILQTPILYILLKLLFKTYIAQWYLATRSSFHSAVTDGYIPLVIVTLLAQGQYQFFAQKICGVYLR